MTNFARTCAHIRALNSFSPCNAVYPRFRDSRILAVPTIHRVLPKKHALVFSYYSTSTQRVEHPVASSYTRSSFCPVIELRVGIHSWWEGVFRDTDHTQTDQERSSSPPTPTPTPTPTHIQSQSHSRTHTQTYARTHTLSLKQARTYAHTHIHTYTRVRTHAHT